MLEIGSLIDGKYKILNEVGHGGMSVVYLAMNERANKQWAIKEVRKDGVKDFEVVVVGIDKYCGGHGIRLPGATPALHEHVTCIRRPEKRLVFFVKIHRPPRLPRPAAPSLHRQWKRR